MIVIIFMLVAFHLQIKYYSQYDTLFFNLVQKLRSLTLTMLIYSQQKEYSRHVPSFIVLPIKHNLKYFKRIAVIWCEIYVFVFLQIRKKYYKYDNILMALFIKILQTF
jgi:hypothetical protein